MRLPGGIEGFMAGLVMRSPAASAFGAFLILCCDLPGSCAAQEPPTIPGLEAIPGLTPIPDREGFPLAEALSRAPQNSKTPGESREERDFSAWFESACAAATESDIGWLGDALLAMKFDPRTTQESYLRLCGLWIRRELAAIAAEKQVPIKVTPEAAELPKGATPLAPELLARWRFTLGSVAPFNRFYEAVDSKMLRRGVLNRDDLLIESRRRALQGETAHLAIDTALLRWRYGCTVGDELEKELCSTILMALLRERRLAEVAGVILNLEDSPLEQIDRAFPGSSASREILQVLGIPWEDFLLGFVAGPVPLKWSTPLAEFRRGGDSPGGTISFQHILVREGSAAAVKLFVDRVWAEPRRERGWFFGSMEELIEPGPFAQGANAHRKVRADVLETELQSSMLEAIHDCLRDNLSESSMLPLIQRLQKIGRIESRDALRPLLQHWSTGVVRATVAALNSLGEKTSAPEPRTPVRYALFLDDRPVAGAQVSYEIGAHGFWDREVKTTDKNGVIELLRDPFLNPAVAGQKVKFSAGEWFSGAPVNPAGQAAALWTVEASQPAALDRVTPVNITSGRLVVSLSLPATIPRGEDGGIRFDILRLDTAASPALKLDWDEAKRVDFPVLPRLELPSLQPGRYRFRICAKGTTEWLSPPVSLTAGTNQMHAALTIGTEIRVPPASIAGTETAFTPPCEVWRDGRKISRHGFPFWDNPDYAIPGLPPGRYLLRVLSSAEIIRLQKAEDPTAAEEDPGADWLGRDFPFEITPATGATLTLGAIELQPATPAMRK